MNFAKDLLTFEEEVPFEFFGFPNGNSNRITNCAYETVDNITVRDVRTSGDDLNLGTRGFKYIRHKSECPLIAQHFEHAGSTVKGNPVVLAYLEESINLIKKELKVIKSSTLTVGLVFTSLYL